MTGSVQGRGEVLLEARNYEQIVGSFLVTRINGHCFNCEPSVRARRPVSAEPDADTDDTLAAESDRLSQQVVRMTCSHSLSRHSSLHRLKQYTYTYLTCKCGASAVRHVSVCVCACACMWVSVLWAWRSCGERGFFPLCSRSCNLLPRTSS